MDVRGSSVVIRDKKHELANVLSRLLGRRVRTKDVIAALGLSSSAYYLQRDENRLISADNLLKLANELEVSPVRLLVRYGLISELSVIEYAQELGMVHAPSSTRPRGFISPDEPLLARPDAPPL